MSKMGKIAKNLFTGNKAIRHKSIIKTTTGAPSSKAPKGTLCYNSFDGDYYINSNGSTTWTKCNP